MPNENAENQFVFCRKIAAQGDVKSIEHEGFDSDPFDDSSLYWIHLDYENELSQKWILEDSGIDSTLVEYLIADDSRPGVIIHDDQLMIALRGINFNENQDPEDLVSIRCYLRNNLIVTLRRRKVYLFESMKNDLDAGNGFKDANDFVLTLLDKLVQEIGRHAGKLDDSISALENALDSEDRDVLFRNSMQYQKEIMSLSRFLHPQKLMLQQFSNLDCNWFSEALQLGIRNLSELHQRYVEDLDFCLERTRIIKETIAAERTELMNSRLYLLAIVSIIFLPLSLLTGLLGVNLSGIPFADHPFAFGALCAGMIALSGVIVLVLKKGKWI